MEFPGGPLVRTWHFHLCDPGSIPGGELRTPTAARWEKKKNGAKGNCLSEIWCKCTVYNH